jgi:hypothetical protein
VKPTWMDLQPKKKLLRLGIVGLIHNMTLSSLEFIEKNIGSGLCIPDSVLLEIVLLAKKGLKSGGCPFCYKPFSISPQYILSDKPAWDICCINDDCKVRPRLFERRDLNEAKRIMRIL